MQELFFQNIQNLSPDLKPIVLVLMVFALIVWQHQTLEIWSLVPNFVASKSM